MIGTMKRIFASVLFSCGLFSSAIFMTVQAATKLPIADPIAIKADLSGHSFKPDQDFVQAVARNDTAAVGRLLDDDFTWTDSQGRTLTKTQVLENLPVPALGDENQADEQDRVNRKIAIHRTERGHIYVLRVWVKHTAGWRALVYQEVSTLAAPPQNDSSAGDCENPCKSVPFTPRNEDEREVIQGYQQVEAAVTAHDSAAWGAHIDDEFFAVTSNSDRPLDKQTRMAGLDHQKQAGIAPFPLVSARMFQYGDTMVMTSLQQPEHGKPLHVTRIWIKQQDKWLELFSYQTTIQ
jgi:hypothetical protein